MRNNIVELNPHSRMTVQGALAKATRLKPARVMVLYFTDDDQFGMLTSSMPKMNTLWALEKAKHHLMNDGDDVG